MSGKIFCEVCQQELADGSLKKHMDVHFQTQDKEYKCDVCEKIFYRKRNLLAHSKMHKENQKQCKVCSKSYQWSVPKSHMLKHSVKKSLMCKLCPKSFAYLVYLNIHIKSVHRTEKLLQCPQCTNTFKEAKGVFQHISAIHMDNSAKNNLFKCNLCEKYISTQTNLNTHMVLTHTEEEKKNLKCVICDKKFLRLADLNNHRRNHAKKEKLFKCMFCQVSFVH